MAIKSLKYLALFAAHMVLAVPLAAQTNGTPDSPAGEVNPGQVDLNNFSLPGRVTRPADRPAEPAPTPRQAEPAPSQAAPTTSQPAPRQSAPAATPDRPTAAPATPTATPSTPAPSFSADSRPTAATPPPSTSARPSLPSPTLLPPEENQGWSFLPLLAGLLGLAGLGVIAWFIRQRRMREAYAGASAIDLVSPRQAEPVPQPVPARAPQHDPVPTGPLPPVAAPAPTPVVPAAPVGIVSTSLRPWIEVELTPDKALIDDKGAAIAFHVTLFNSGAAPARDVSIEACLLNAGALQDRDLGEFYAKPRPEADTIPLIPPQSRIPLRTAVRLSRDDIREYEVEGRKIFAPMVAVSTRYRWSSGEGQTGSSFLVGRGQSEADKLGPLRVDQGNRTWNGLTAKRYEKGLRN